MINRFGLLRNIGQFDSVTVPATFQHQRLTVVYAENGRGKTTLTAILRSFATGDPLPIRERRRLGAAHPPHVILHCTTALQPAVFENDAWSRTRPNIAVFDDAFVNENIYSGLSVDTEHRQNLHELIIGSQGVTLNQQLQDLVAQVEEHNRNLRNKANDIPVAELADLSVDDFCALPPQDNIDAAIEATERSLAAVREQDPVRNGGLFQPLRLPRLDTASIVLVLQRDLPDLDAAAASRVQAHISRLGRGGETWISDGIQHVQARIEGENAETCPFCAQDLAMSPVLSHYRAYFSEAYAALKRVVTDAVTDTTRLCSADSLLDFERTIRINGERREFWSRFCTVPDTALDTSAITAQWRVVSEAVLDAIRAKQAAPLERMQLAPEVVAAIAAFDVYRETVEALNVQLTEANESIRAVKAQAAAADPVALASALKRLRAINARHSLATASLCAVYLIEKTAKATTEERRDRARADLDAYRTCVFPTYQAAINRYLQLFNAGFHLDCIQPVNNRGGSACSYNVVINNSSISVAGRVSPAICRLSPGAV
jgi:wobble nucleotide-excising tRNase